MDTFKKIENYITSFVQPSQSQLDYFIKFLKVQTVKKNEMLIQSGDICNDVWFINSGILRHYLINNEKEGTVWFSFEGYLITEIDSFITKKPAVHNIIAITDAELLCMNYADLEHLYATDIIWERFGRLTTIQYLLFQMERVNDLLFKTGKEKYDSFINAHPEALQYITLQQISDYIGVKPETLSRIRGRI